jgi:YHS domain-containing protein
MRFLPGSSCLIVMSIIAMPCFASDTDAMQKKNAPDKMIGDTGRATPTGVIGDTGRSTPTGVIGDTGRSAPTGMIGDTGRPRQTIDPVSGKAIDRNVFVDYKGKRVYFNNKKSIGQFKKDPDKYMKRLGEKDHPWPEPPPREMR